MVFPVANRVVTGLLWRWGYLTLQLLACTLNISSSSCQMRRFIFIVFIIFFHQGKRKQSFSRIDYNLVLVLQPILEAKATAVWLDKSYRPIRIPAEVRSKFVQFIRHEELNWVCWLEDSAKMPTGWRPGIASFFPAYPSISSEANFFFFCLALFFVNLGVSHTKKEAFFFFCSFGQGVGRENVTKLLPLGSENVMTNQMV